MASRFAPQIVRAASRQSSLIRISASRSFVSATTPMLEKKTVKVPTMGDSITEGTIVEWTAQIGQKVKDGDVVALVETDKVTVDIKANMDGVITQQFGSVDDTVEVGSDLYELDTEAEATVEAGESAPLAAASKPKESAPAPPTPAAPAKAASSSPPKQTQQQQQQQQHRVPSIHFLGKEGWTRKLAGVPELPPVPTNFGRPAFTEEEMEALMTGGANLVPNVKQHSNGAVFGY
mmetsp:Transcript_23955/g.68180  ORF Transcript_23955/g.68180 Transcript_23955/m.68180 type:complete len:234 (+) Transcript_23955:89-790(+)